MIVELNSILDELNRASTAVTKPQIAAVVNSVKSANRIFVYGTGRSGLMLKAFAMRLMQLGFHPYVVGETITPSIETGDLLIVASASGKTQSVLSAVKNAKKAGAAVLSITADSKSVLAELQPPVIVIDAATKYAVSMTSVQPLGSLFEQMLLLIFDSVVLNISATDARANRQMAQKHANIE